MKKIFNVLILFVYFGSNAQNVEYLKDSLGNKINISTPCGISQSRKGELFVTSQNGIIYKIKKNGAYTTMKGYVNGVFTNISLANPCGICIDTNGVLYIAENSKHRIVRVDTNLIVSYIGKAVSTGKSIDGIGINAIIREPYGLYCDKKTNNIYFTQLSGLIRKISNDSTVSTVAGIENYSYNCSSFKDDTVSKAIFNTPTGIWGDYKGNFYVNDWCDAGVRKIENGYVKTIFGKNNLYNGGYLEGVVVDKFNNIYFSLNRGKIIKKIDKLGNLTDFVTGLNYVDLMHITDEGIIYAAENFGNSIRVITLDNYQNSYLNPIIIQAGIPNFFNYSDFSKGRSKSSYPGKKTCNTTQDSINALNMFFKFTASQETMYLNLNLNNSNLESRLLLTSPINCRNILLNKNLRTDTLDGLIVGNEYTIVYEVAGTTNPGYARLSELTKDASITLFSTLTGIENTFQSTVSLYPNPSQGGKIYVQTKEAIQNIKVSNTMGQSETFTGVNEFTTTLKGLLLVTLQTSKGLVTQKVFVE